MPSVLLLHTNTEYAVSLADTIESVAPEYDVTVVSREPMTTRLDHLLLEDYDLVQTDELLVNGVLAAISSFRSGSPLVTSVRGWADYTNAHGEYGPVRDTTIRVRTEFVLGRSSAVIYLSDRTRAEFEERYAVNDGSVIGRPIDIEHYSSGKNSDSTTFGLLTVTNLRYEGKYQGVIDILEGLKSIFPRHDELQYTVAGAGRYLEPLWEYVESYPYSDRVNILGYREDVPELLADADAFVYVSYLDAYPTVVLEAQAAGLPVIGGDAVGVPAVVGDAGVVCDTTPEGLAEAIDRVLTDDAFREELATKSEAKMETYNEDSARQHAAVWDRVLDHS